MLTYTKDTVASIAQIIITCKTKLIPVFSLHTVNHMNHKFYLFRTLDSHVKILIDRIIFSVFTVIIIIHGYFLMFLQRSLPVYMVSFLVCGRKFWVHTILPSNYYRCNFLHCPHISQICYNLFRNHVKYCDQTALIRPLMIFHFL